MIGVEPVWVAGAVHTVLSMRLKWCPPHWFWVHWIKGSFVVSVCIGTIGDYLDLLAPAMELTTTTIVQESTNITFRSVIIYFKISTIYVSSLSAVHRDWLVLWRNVQCLCTILKRNTCWHVHQWVRYFWHQAQCRKQSYKPTIRFPASRNISQSMSFIPPH